MTRNLILASACLLPLAACSPATTAALTGPAAQIAYQAALGELQQAETAHPTLDAKLVAYQKAAAPYVAAVEQGIATAATAENLSALTTGMVADAAPFITVTPNGK